MKRTCIIALALAAIIPCASRADTVVLTPMPDAIGQPPTLLLEEPSASPGGGSQLSRCILQSVTVTGNFSTFTSPTVTSIQISVSGCPGWQDNTTLPVTVPPAPPIVPGITPMCTNDGIHMVPCGPGMY